MKATLADQYKVGFQPLLDEAEQRHQRELQGVVELQAILDEKGVSRNRTAARYVLIYLYICAACAEAELRAAHAACAEASVSLGTDGEGADVSEDTLRCPPLCWRGVRLFYLFIIDKSHALNLPSTQLCARES